MLLEEEMRRVMRFLKCREQEWLQRAAFDDEDCDNAIHSGMRGYALKQAYFCLAAASRFQSLWSGKDCTGENGGSI